MVTTVDLPTLLAALDTIDEGIGIYDAEDRLIAFNKHYAAWRSAIGGDVTRGVCWKELVRESIECGAIPEAIGREEEWLEQRCKARGSYSIIRKLADGRAFKVNERRMTNDGIAVVWTDVSDLVRAGSDRAEAVARDEQRLQAMGQLVASVAHDFNNLLTGVMGNIELLRRHLPSPTERVARLLENAMHGVQRGAKQSQRLLSFSRRKSTVQLEFVDLPTLVSGMSDLLHAALGVRIRLEIRLPLHLPQLHVDTNQLEVALLNLAVNARDAMNGSGWLIIAARAEHDAGAAGPAKSYVVISVTDTGAGMNEATLSRATEPLFTTKGDDGGTGLGLAMVHGFAVGAGGKLVLHSTVGMGTTAELWLPSTG